MTFKKILLSCILFFYFFSFLNSQSITWTKVYGGSDDDIAHSVKQTPDGGYIVIGSTTSYGSYYFNIWILRLDQYGDTLWSVVYDSLRGKNEIELDYNGGYIFAGSIINETSFYDLIIIKTDINGDSLWSKRYIIHNQCCYYNAYDIDKTFDSCYVIAGNAMYQNSSGFLFKINQNGDSLWATTYGDEMFISSVCETPDKGFFTTLSAQPWKEVNLIKFDSLGNYMFHKFILDTLNTNVRDIEKLVDNNYIMISPTYLVKINSSADTIWTRHYSGGDVVPTEDSGCVITGGNGDLYLIKFNKDGDSLWSAEYGGSGSDGGYSIEQTADGGYIIAGVTDSYGAGNGDFYIIKTDSLGFALGVEEQVVNPNLPCFDISYISNQNGNIEFYFSLPQSDNIKLEIFDLSGRLVSTPVSDNFSEGEHKINITLPNSGVYIYRFTSSVYEQSGLPAIAAGKLIVF